jgi:tripartite-type tricarboxylate transporter receptor subunit TctC
MTLLRRRFLQLSVAATLATLPRSAFAQAFPNRPLRFVVPFPPGGATDIIGRLLAQWLTERLGQTVVVENRPGAGSNLGTEAVVRAAPDGHTFLLVNAANAINATLYDKLAFNFMRDIAPVGSIARASLVLLVNPDFPARTVPEFIAYAKANPGKVLFASAGNGNSSHLAGEMFKSMTGVDIVHVPYRGGAPAIVDLLAGRVHAMFPDTLTAGEQLKAGRLRPIAVCTPFRSPALPDTPTIAEYVPGYDASSDRAAQRRDQRRAGRSEAEGATDRHGCALARRHSGGIRQADRRRDREMGQGGKVFGRQARLTRGKMTAIAAYRRAATLPEPHPAQSRPSARQLVSPVKPA